ncbi:hypothetical protein C8R42DRAFT_729540 [Lentinula raphanica]|nr:hypothetical protein C8R42DRAFT_729540 [Lentinula raphanica]
MIDLVTVYLQSLQKTIFAGRITHWYVFLCPSPFQPALAGVSYPRSQFTLRTSADTYYEFSSVFRSFVTSFLNLHRFLFPATALFVCFAIPLDPESLNNYGPSSIVQIPQCPTSPTSPGHDPLALDFSLVPVPGGGGGNGGNERSSAPHVPEALNEVPMTVAETKAHPVTGADVPVGFEAKDPAVLREKAQIQALEEGVGEEREKVEGEKEGKQPSGAQQLGTQRLGSQALRSIRTSGSASLQGSKPVYVSPGSSVGLP